MPDDTFKEFVLDQLGALPELRARALSGVAFGLWPNLSSHRLDTTT
jgi:hypothetical protein